MNPPPNALTSAGLAVDQRPARVADVAEAGRSRGRLHAVPVLDVVSSSHWLAEAVYRGFEVLAALFGLVAGLPLLLILAAMIRYDSPGPVFFLHQRPGRSRIVRGRDLKGRANLLPPPGGFDADSLYYVPSYFTLVKFRTMYSDARTRFPDFYAYKYTPDEFHRQYPTIRHDPRVTRVGRVLRKLSVDELPNLWSVLAGDLRLVGPRPEAPEVLRYYSPEEIARDHRPRTDKRPRVAELGRDHRL
jgi:lipopolysaccharide/colanic/teichoic acid biosynthesis glycosyltransferase